MAERRTMLQQEMYEQLLDQGIGEFTADILVHAVLARTNKNLAVLVHPMADRVLPLTPDEAAELGLHVRFNDVLGQHPYCPTCRNIWPCAKSQEPSGTGRES